MASLVVTFDFDKTIIDCESDNWVVEELGLNHLFSQLLHNLPWNSLMDRMMIELHNQGKTIEDIEECLKKVPLHPSIDSAIKLIHTLGCDLRIVSDANVFFIETILKYHGLLDCFTEINTNPSLVDDQGRLRVLPYYDFGSSSHGCNICPSNMCKGMVMEKIRESVSADGKKQLVYVGDGIPDFCAGLKLEEGDVLMPRKGFPIWDMISANPLLIKAKIHEWSDWDELGTNLLSIVNTTTLIDESTSNARSDQLVVLDCKYQTAHEALQKGLPVSHPN